MKFKDKLCLWGVLILCLSSTALAISAIRQTEGAVVPTHSSVDLGKSGEAFDNAYVNDVYALSQLVHDVGTIAAAGNSQATATAIVDQVTYVTGADNTKGVVLPLAAPAGSVFIVHNTGSATTLALYPNTSDKINGGTANAAVTVAAEETAILIQADSTNWYGGVAVDF